MLKFGGDGGPEPAQQQEETDWLVNSPYQDMDGDNLRWRKEHLNLKVPQ
jgi:hypothetical protein